MSWRAAELTASRHLGGVNGSVQIRKPPVSVARQLDFIVICSINRKLKD